MDEKGNGYTIDPEKLTVDDWILVDDVAAGGIAGKARAVKELLGRLIVDKTEDEIGQLTLPELGQLLEAVDQTVDEAAAPKASGSASPTS